MWKKHIKVQDKRGFLWKMKGLDAWSQCPTRSSWQIIFPVFCYKKSKGEKIVEHLQLDVEFGEDCRWAEKHGEVTLCLGWVGKGRWSCPEQKVRRLLDCFVELSEYHVWKGNLYQTEQTHDYKGRLGPNFMGSWMLSQGDSDFSYIYWVAIEGLWRSKGNEQAGSGWRTERIRVGGCVNQLSIAMTKIPERTT